jgi:hypothetical protein
MKLEGYFMTIERANEAMAKLKEAGFNNSYIEIDNNNRNIQRNLADTNSAYRLANFIVDPSEIKSAPLTAISPIINVKAGFSEFDDNNYRIVVEADKGSVSKAESVIKSVGGSFRNDVKSMGRVNEDIGELNINFKENGV